MKYLLLLSLFLIGCESSTKVSIQCEAGLKEEDITDAEIIGGSISFKTRSGMKIYLSPAVKCVVIEKQR